MKSMLKFLSLAAVALTLVFASCSKDDDPVNNDFFAGTYKGKITYKSSDKSISKDDGSVFVTKVASGTKYNFAFSDGIPNLNNVEFEKKGDNSLISTGDYKGLITIDNKHLTIAINDGGLFNGQTWTADCNR